MMPYASPDGYHRHSCPECGCIWEHADSNRGDIAAPDCSEPECWFHYSGSCKPKHKERKRRKKQAA
jgi:hypothetical protein